MVRGDLKENRCQYHTVSVMLLMIISVTCTNVKGGDCMVVRQYELVRESVKDWKYNAKIENDNGVADFLKNCMKIGNKDRECFIVISLNAKGNVTGVAVESTGCLTSSIVHPREIFKQAILSNACSVILAHNHPSGDVTPSADDIQTTGRLEKAGEILGIRVLDHVIVGGESHYSFKKGGLIC